MSARRPILARVGSAESRESVLRDLPEVGDVVADVFGNVDGRYEYEVLGVDDPGAFGLPVVELRCLGRR